MGRRDDHDEFEIESMDNRLAKHQAGGRPSLKLPQGLSLWKPKKSGSHNIDIIPYRVTENAKRFAYEFGCESPGRWYYERTFHVHQGIGVNNDSHTCLAKTFGKRCPICEARDALNKSPYKEDRQKAKELNPKERQLFLIFDYDDPDKGIQLWEIAHFNFGKQLDAYVKGARKQDQDSYRRFYHRTEGYEMRINGVESPIGEGGGKNTVYSVHQFYPREKPLPDSLLQHGYDLDDIVRELDYTTLKEIFEGGVDAIPADDDRGARSRRDSRSARDEEEPPSRARSRRDEEEPPARSSRSRRDEEEPEPEPAPRTARRSRSEDPEPAPARSRREDPEPRPAAKQVGELPFASRDEVSFQDRDGTTYGVIDHIVEGKKIAYVKVKGRERPAVLGFEEMTLVRRDDTFDAKPDDPPARNGKAAPPDDPEPAPARSSRSARKDDSAWDDDDRTSRRKPEPAAEPDEDATPRRGRR